MATNNKLTAVQRLFLTARDKGVPLIKLLTPDATATLKGLTAECVLDEHDKPAPSVRWDCVRGLFGLNPPGEAVASVLGGNKIINPVEALVKMAGAPADSCFFLMNLNDHFADPRVRQALFNLRDPFESNHRTCAFTQPHGNVPAVLEQDVLEIDEAYPTPEELAVIVRKSFSDARLPDPDKDTLRRAVDSVAGLAAFSAKQAVSLCLTRAGVDFEGLRARHRQMIENTKGLHVWKGGEKFADIGGLRAAIDFMRRFIRVARYRFGAVLLIDEIEKMFAGIKGDLNGIAQWTLGRMLSYMEDEQITGILLMGHPGTGKSLLAKAVGNEAGVPGIRFDSGEMQGSLVGQSQEALLNALKIVQAVSQGKPLVIATCNSVAVLPAELIDRFRFRYFVDMPDDEEKAVIWPVHLRAYGLDLKQARPNDTGWNGREIRQCAETAYTLDVPLMEAAQHVVPIVQSAAEEIERRRAEASDRYLSASHAGAYQHKLADEVSVGSRRIKMDRDEAPAWVAPSSGKPS